MASRARRRLFLTAVVLVVANRATTACSYDWELPASDAGPGASDGASDSAPTSDAPTSDAPDALEDGSVADTKPPPDVTSEREPIDCIAGGAQTCAPDSYCKSTLGSCGGVGTCTPLTCDTKVDPYAYFCACKGIFKSECDALSQGGGFSTQCAPPLDSYACGYLFCVSKALCVQHPLAMTSACVAQGTCGASVDCSCSKDPCDGGTGQCLPVDGGATWTCK
jgi:hypothetical protein